MSGNKIRLVLTIIGCVIVALFVINLIRLNPPAALQDEAPTPEVSSHSDGPIVNGEIAIEPGSFLQYRLNFNYRSTIKGTFKVRYGSPWIACLILTEPNFEKWKAGQEFVATNSTGKVPKGVISRRLEAGVYYLVFDNRTSQQKATSAEADFSVE